MPVGDGTMEKELTVIPAAHYAYLPWANTTIVSYNATSSLVRFENKSYFSAL
jgi:hypothetical protein